MPSRLKSLTDQLNAHADDMRATHSMRFFKTGKGQYGEGDQFLGITMPKTREICKDFRDLSLDEIQELLDSPFHEYRMAAVVIMSDVFKKSSEEKQQALYELYLKNTESRRINNWDLVDVSAKFVVGAYLVKHPEKVGVLYELANSPDLWQKRVAILSTPAFITVSEPKHTLALAKILLYDPHDLIQKAVGWMLREVGKRNSQGLLLDFLEEYAGTMPRTALRYALEHLTLEQKHYFMTK